MRSSHLIDRSIELFYNSASEEHRLKQGLGPLEFERSQELILRYLTTPNSTIMDVGGGTGHYAKWLAGLGHTVHLVDPVQKHIDLARRKASAPHFFHCHLGEAQQLDQTDDMADLVILHGPLYHLQEKSHRLNALREARRVLKPGGVLLGFAINFTASTFACLANGLLHAPEMFDMCLEELSSGLHNPPPGWPGLLPQAYFHKPHELQAEVQEAGFRFMNMVGVETCIWLEKNYFQSRADEQRWYHLRQLGALFESEPSVLGLSPHFMIAASK